MADYILNHVIVEGSQKQIKNLLATHFRELTETEQWRRPFAKYEFLWQDIIPVPKKIARSGDIGEIEDWQEGHWKCFCAGPDKTETNFGQNGTFNFQFPTWWEAPRPVYKKLVKQFPRLKFNFASISMPNFCVFIGFGIGGKLTCVDDVYV